MREGRVVGAPGPVDAAKKRHNGPVSAGRSQLLVGRNGFRLKGVGMSYRHGPTIFD